MAGVSPKPRGFQKPARFRSTVILDGAMGTELTRRGVDTTLPLWSARALMEAPQVVEQIHLDYIAAGSQVITANTFRTNPRTMQRAGFTDEGRALTHEAVRLAKAAAAKSSNGSGPVKVAGSMAPVEDCYSPWLVPDDDALAAEHGILARHLAEAGCDLILVETMNTIREAVAAAHAAQQTGLPVWVSFTLNDQNTLLSGENLADAVQAVMPFEPAALLVNCIPVAQISSALKVLHDGLNQSGAQIETGTYGNVGHVDDEVGWTLTHAVSPTAYAEAALEWRALGATIIGGCCGTMPAHIGAVAAKFAEAT